MTSRDLIDAQFDRAVEIVQSLPKNGPIQTGYEEKLTMYSLYKQATVGNVKSPRPGIFDMLGRAKWDAWAKHKDLDQYEAKWLYVDALLKVLRRYSDKTIARDYVRELESYGGDPSNLVMSRSMTKTARTTSSGSSASDDQPSPTHYPPQLQRSGLSLSIPGSAREETTSEEDTDDEVHDRVPATLNASSVYNRPQSSLSSHRYRTPMAGSLAMSPPPMQAPGPSMTIPVTQPHPGFESVSAFEGTLSPARSRPPSTHPPAMASYQSPYAQSPPNIYPSAAIYCAPSAHQFPPARQYSSGPVPGPVQRQSLERTVENVQAHLAALTERLETLEALTGHPRHSSQSLASRVAGSGRGSPDDGHDEYDAWSFNFNLEDMGMWSLVLRPLARVASRLRQLASFLAHSEGHSPTLMVIRRLFLDISFVLTVTAALIALWHAVVGRPGPRAMVDRGV
ncbi:ACBP-domain-containing protein, partial [Gloeophyllum trabeum ATCC 11539]